MWWLIKDDVTEAVRMICFDHVSKHYRGLIRRTRALEDLSLYVGPGEIVGLVGPNGAGKTTLIQIALGFLWPTAGRVTVLGRPPGDVSVRSRIGWVPDEIIRPRTARGAAFVEEWLAGHGVLGPRGRERVRELFELFGISHAAERPIRTYSLGMQQKVSLILALSHGPDLLVLDEPFSSLDHRAVLLVGRILEEHRRKEGAVLVSSHHLADLQRVCTRAVFLSGGRIVRDEELHREGAPLVVDVVVQNPEHARAVLERSAAAPLSDWSLTGDSLTGRVEGKERLASLIAFLVSEGVRVETVSERGAGLEETFLKMEARG